MSSPIECIFGKGIIELDERDFSGGKTFGEALTHYFNRINKHHHHHHCVNHQINMMNQMGMNNNMNAMNQFGMNNNDMNMMNQIGMNNNMPMINQVGMNNINKPMINQVEMNNNMPMMNQFIMNNNDMNMVNQSGINNNRPLINQFGMNNINNMNMMNQIGINNKIPMMNQVGMSNNDINFMPQMGMIKNIPMMNQVDINHNINMMPQMGVINNIPMMNQIGINNNYEIEKCLNYFLDFISFENKEKLIFNGVRLAINYYNIKKYYVNIDLNLKAGEIIQRIYWQLFYSVFKKEKHMRTERNQTTEYIIKNPIYEMDFEECPFQYSNFLYLEFNNKDISISSNITGVQLGLKEGSEILLKIKKEFYDEILKFPIVPVTIYIQTDYCNKETEFPININGISYETFSKFFNNANYRLSVNVDGYSRNVNLITENCDLALYKRIIGGSSFPALNFVDVENNKIKNLNFSQKSPKWRKIAKGLNIFGFCNNPKCEAFNNEVVYMTNLPNDGLNFNLNEKVADIRCPICSKIIKPKTCGFYDCEYQFVGEKIDEGEIKKYDSKTRETFGNNFEYFDALKNGEIVWIKLNIYVLPKQKIKYSPF